MALDIMNSSDTHRNFASVQRRNLSLSNAQRTTSCSEIYWTANRCQRLLRPLTSRLAILAREHTHQTLHNGAHDPRRGQVNLDASNVDQDDSQSCEDPIWQPRKKQLRRVYSTQSTREGRRKKHFEGFKPTSRGKEQYAPGELSIPTPMLMRSRKDYLQIRVETPAKGIHSTDMEDGRSPKRRKTKNPPNTSIHLSEKLRELRKETTSQRYSIYEGIYHGLEALLRATSKDEQACAVKRPKSLFSLCLRAVPKHIAQMERKFSVELEEAGAKSIDSRDISADIYDDLENFGSYGRGWKALRAIVRSHGLQIVCKAISEGLFQVEFCEALIKLAGNMAAPDETEMLLSSLLSLYEFPHPQTVHARFIDDVTTRPLSILWDLFKSSGQSHSFYRQLSLVVCNRSLPAEWLATKQFNTVWTDVLGSLASREAGPAALKYISCSLSALALLGKAHGTTTGNLFKVDSLLNASKRTLSSMLAAICAISILGEGSELSSGDDLYAREILHDVCLECDFSDSSNLGYDLFLIASIITSSSAPTISAQSFGAVKILLDRLSQPRHSPLHTRDGWQQVSKFICYVAHLCGRGTSSSGFEYLRRAHQLMEAVADNDTTHGADILKQIVVESAVLFAERAPNCQAHLDYATNVDSRYHAKAVMSKSKSKHQIGSAIGSPVGYRWEEGISEWIAATPLVTTSKPMDTFLSTSAMRFDSHLSSPDFSSPILRHDEVATETESSSSILKLTHDSPGLPKQKISKSCHVNTRAPPARRFNPSQHRRPPPPGSRVGPADVKAGPRWHQSSSKKGRCSTRRRPGRFHVGQAPQPSRASLASSKNRPLFEDSDDEISLVSISSQKGDVLRDVTNVLKQSSRGPRPNLLRCTGNLEGASDDELL